MFSLLSSQLVRSKSSTRCFCFDMSCFSTPKTAKIGSFHIVVHFVPEKHEINLVLTTETGNSTKIKIQKSIFANNSRLRRDIVFLISNSESTQHSASYRHFLAKNDFCVNFLENEGCSGAKSNFCCSLTK